MKKILVVEDDTNIRNMLTSKLKSSGFVLTIAVDGSDAISKFKKERPVLVLVDLILPKQSGFEVIEAIRIKYNSQIPIIVLSNLDQPQDRETALRLGVNEYIVKSNVSLRDLILKIQELLRK